MTLEEQVKQVRNKYIEISESEQEKLIELLKRYSYYNYLKQNRYFVMEKTEAVIINKVKFNKWNELNSIQLKITKTIMLNIHSYEIMLTSLILNVIHQDKEFKHYEIFHKAIRNSAYSVLNRLNVKSFKKLKGLEKNNIEQLFDIYKRYTSDIIRGQTIGNKHKILIEYDKKNFIKLDKLLSLIPQYKIMKENYENGQFGKKKILKKEDINKFFSIIEHSRNCIYHGIYWSGDLSHKNNKPRSNYEYRLCYYMTFNNQENKNYIEKIVKNRSFFNDFKKGLLKM
ncbi:MAG: hypothetical protein ACK5HR_00155 [Mycoplasmatales bacterium]